MARGGRRYRLMIYEHMLNRWWPATLTMAIVMGALAYSVYLEPLGRLQPWRWYVQAGVGGLALLETILFLILRKVAYVQVFPAHLLLALPFFRVNISYKRFKRVTTAETRRLFPPRSISGWLEDIIAPLGNKTALVLELNAYPVSRYVLRIFLSTFFFKPKDKTPHLIILVKDWMLFSSELDSMRTGGGGQQQARPEVNSILSRLPHK